MFGFASGAYGEPFRGPWEEDRTEKTSYRQTSSELNPLRSLVIVHRSYISPIDGKTCPMYPSCSKYSLLCFEKHGLFIGWVMTCDRLLHEPDETGKAAVICINGVERFYDPLENNDFWWHSER
jgi:putative component of membrane protein insertase Oxa1/YidC/SpoIIIJ protein YidD